MTETEYAGGRGGSNFPAHWGLPEGRGSSEERVSWILRNVGEDQALKRRGFNPAEARTGKRSRNAHAALAKALRLRATI
jgi:hypothetical protein